MTARARKEGPGARVLARATPEVLAQLEPLNDKALLVQSASPGAVGLRLATVLSSAVRGIR
eukprot:1617273-Rhodomonas_salina.1